jgi:RNA polymerase sigma-70 factor (ECF subfamily)
MLPPDQQEALLLVGALGLSYDEAAIICGIPVGTIRGRIHRARLQLSSFFARATTASSHMRGGVTASLD